MFLSEEGPTLKTLDFAFHIGSTPTFLHLNEVSCVGRVEIQIEI